MLERKVIEYKYKEFIKKYGNLYTEDALNYIEENFWNYLGKADAPDILNQIYSFLGIIDKSIYDSHIEKIEENFGIKKDILEVGCGFIPAFAQKVAKKQIKLKSGTITGIDPLLSITKNKYGNMKLYRKSFDSSYDVRDFDLIIGIYPCEATESIIRSACQSKKDFYLAMCGCTHFNEFQILQGYPITPEFYQDYVIDLAEYLLKENNNGKLCIDKLTGEFESMDYPILYNKK